MHLCESELNDQWADCTAVFCDVHINKGVILNLQRTRVICGCRAVQTNSAEPPLALCCICSYCQSVTIYSAQARPQYSLNALVYACVCVILVC